MANFERRKRAATTFSAISPNLSSRRSRTSFERAERLTWHNRDADERQCATRSLQSTDYVCWRNIAISGQSVPISMVAKRCASQQQIGSGHQDRLRAIEIDPSSRECLLQRTVDSPDPWGRQDEVVGYLAPGGRCSPTYVPPRTGTTLSERKESS